MKYKRVCLFGGPGCAKSVTAMALTAELKKLHINAEYVSEYIKTQAIQGRLPRSFEQLYIFAKQLHREDRILEHVDYIVTDSPMLLNSAYAAKYNAPFAEQLLDITYQFEYKYPSLNIFLDRTGIPYQTKGRYETIEQAVHMDMFIKDFLNKNITYKTIKSAEFSSILSYVKSELGL